MVLLGPGGTGKTTVLRAQEALNDHFIGPEAVRKCAISNTAARLLGGDTMHALCKLPPHGLHGKRGQLSTPVLRHHRQKWYSAHAVFIDEVSMVGKGQLHQCDVRIRQAKQTPLKHFGGLATVAAGDFMQLPPVKKSSSIALPMDDEGTMPDTKSDEDASGTDAENVQADGEQRQGMTCGIHSTPLSFFNTEHSRKGRLRQHPVRNVPEGSIRCLVDSAQRACPSPSHKHGGCTRRRFKPPGSTIATRTLQQPSGAVHCLPTFIACQYCI